MDCAEQLHDALEGLSRAGAEERGAVFTRPEVVRRMLDWLGYAPERDLRGFRLLEPCFGRGEFLLEALERLLEAHFSRGGNPRNADELEGCLRGVEVHRESHGQVVHKVIDRLAKLGIARRLAAHLAHTWLIQGDFLLADLETGFTHVVGNPPYLRLERIPPALLAEYRRRYPTFRHRADLYVPFFERGLQLLAPGGRLAYLCTDRWMKNRYGQPLRRLIAENYRLDGYANLRGEQPFQRAVSAYPAITVITRAKEPWAQARPEATPPEGPWLLELGADLERLREWERRFPTLEEVGCRVGVGVASGADAVLVQPADLDIEEDRKLPLLLAADVRSGRIAWSGRVLVNPFDAEGRLVDLARYPRLRAYLEAHRSALKRRCVARKHPEQWFRTLDRVDPALQHTPKLLIPDLAKHPIVVLDQGRYYPHHNLYWVTSRCTGSACPDRGSSAQSAWPLPALQAVLRSPVAALFVRAYSVEMRGGYYRYQAQTLRRIRLPRWPELPEEIRQDLASGVAWRQQRALAWVYGL